MAEDNPIEEQVISEEEIIELDKKEEMKVAPKKKSIFRGLWWKLPVFFILFIILIIALLPVYSGVFISPIVSVLESATGNQVSIDSLKINVFASHITLKNFVMKDKVSNNVVADIEVLDVDVSVLALLMGRINIPTADIKGVHLNYELPEAVTTTTTTTTTTNSTTTTTKTKVSYSKDNPVTVDIKLPEVFAHINIDNINVHITNASKTLNLQLDNFYFKCDINTLNDIQYKSGSKNAISVAGFDSGFKYNFEGKIAVDTSNKNVICTAKGDFRLDDLYAKKEGLVDISNHSIVFSHDISSNLNDASLTVADLSFKSKYAGMAIKDFKMKNGYEVLSLANKVAEQAQSVMEQAKQDLQNVNVNNIDLLNYDGLQGTISYYLDLDGLYDDWGKFIAQVTNNLVTNFGGKIEMEGRWNQPSNFTIKIQPKIFVNGAFKYEAFGSVDLQSKEKQKLQANLSCNFADLQPFLRVIIPDIQLQGNLEHNTRLYIEKQSIVGQAKGSLTGFNMVMPNNGQVITCKLDTTNWDQKVTIVADIKKPTVKLDTCDIKNPAFSMKSKGKVVYDSKKLLTEYNILFPIIDIPALMNVVSVTGTSNAVENTNNTTQNTQPQNTTEQAVKSDALLCLQPAHIDALKSIGLNFELKITKLIIDASNTIQNFIIKSTLNNETTDNKCNLSIKGKINDGTLSFNVDADCSVPHPDCAVSYNLNQIPYNLAMADMITNSFPLLKKISFSNDGKVALNMKGNYQWKGIDTRAIFRSLISKEDNTLSLPSGSLDFTADSDSLLGPMNTVSEATEKLEKEIKNLEDTLSKVMDSVSMAEKAVSAAKLTGFLNKSAVATAQKKLNEVLNKKNSVLSQLEAKKAELQKQTKNTVSPLNYSFDSLTVTFGIENDNPWTGIENQLNNHPYSKIVYKSINCDTNNKFPKITGWTGLDGSYEFNINLSNITNLPVLNKGLIFSNNGVSLGK